VTDLDTKGPSSLKLPQPEIPGRTAVVEEPLWRIRLRLARRAFSRNWKLFTRNKIGVAGLLIIVLFGLMALIHPFLMGRVWDPAIYDPFNGYDAPRTQLTVVEKCDIPVDAVSPTCPPGEIDLASARLKTHPFVKVGEVIEIPQQPAAPSKAHWLGTDPLGRDILSQLMFSTQAAFKLGAIAALMTVFIATSIGSIAAYYSGWIDSVLMRFADLVLLVPLIPVLIVMSALLPGIQIFGIQLEMSLTLLGVLIGILSGFGGTAIVLKSQALSVTVKPFVDAARVAGGSNAHIIFRHIIPNVLPLSFLYMMFTVTDAISLEATLSFLGLMNTPMSWGIMIYTTHSQGYLLSGTSYWWLLIPAGMAVTLMAASFFLVGRAMDEVINPRLRRR
jgi:peptide/nickel transport system permease protein